VGVGPRARNQLVLAEQFARPFGQSNEEIKGAATDMNGRACFKQEPLPGK